MSYGEGTLDQQAISYAKQRLRDGVGDATIMVELQQKFAPITEGAVAAMYLMAAKRDAPRPRSFRMTAQVVDRKDGTLIERMRPTLLLSLISGRWKYRCFGARWVRITGLSKSSALWRPLLQRTSLRSSWIPMPTLQRCGISS